MKTLLAALAALMLLCAPAHADPTIAAVGDAACLPTSAVTPTQCQQQAVSSMVLARHPARLLMMGDAQYDRGALDAFKASYDPSYGRLFDVTCPVPGNHEYMTAGAADFYGYFASRAGPSGGRTCNLPALAPNWTIVGLDSGPQFGCTLDSWQSGGGITSCVEQRQFLDAQMSKAPTCELAFWHHPRWTSETSDAPRVQPFLDTFYARHGDLILTGHAHAYERSWKVNPAGQPDPQTGFRQVTAGTGGVNLRPIDNPVRAFSAVRLSRFGALFVTLHPASYDLRFVSVDGVVRDQVIGAACRA